MALPRLENPLSPWDRTVVDYFGEPPEVRLEVFEDTSKSILSKNDSPDLGFRYSVNPYRGCFHACAYCYARPTHEYLGFGAGTDFERRIVVKPLAPELLRRALSKKSWRGERILFSGNTDCYQPLEARYELTRRCLAVCLEHRQALHVITKSPLVERDVDLLAQLAQVTSVGVTVSIPFASAEHARKVEPYVATPARRFAAIRKLSEAGLTVGVNVAPIIPGLNDEELPEVLERAREAGAIHAAYILLRLPGNVRSVFEARISEALPLRAERILARTREVRSGRENDPRFGTRMTGEGVYAESIARLFEVTSRRLGYRQEGRWGADGPREVVAGSAQGGGDRSRALPHEVRGVPDRAGQPVSSGPSAPNTFRLHSSDVLRGDPTMVTKPRAASRSASARTSRDVPRAKRASSTQLDLFPALGPSTRQDSR
jgi:DNA repair photolyase